MNSEVLKKADLSDYELREKVLRQKEQLELEARQLEKEKSLYARNYVTGATDEVNRPPHYNTGKIEVIDFIEDQKLNFHSANAVKYICRAPHKGTQKQDLQKAIWYLTRQLKVLEGNGNV